MVKLDIHNHKASLFNVIIINFPKANFGTIKMTRLCYGYSCRKKYEHG